MPERFTPVIGKPRRTFVLRGLLTLAAIYSRGTYRPTTIDVLMFHFRVRNGTGWDHQAMTTRLRGALSYLLTVYPVGHVFAALLLRRCLLKQQTDIRVAMRRVNHHFFCVELFIT